MTKVNETQDFSKEFSKNFQNFISQFDEFKERLEKVEKELSESKSLNNDEFIGVDEVSKILGIGKSQIYQKIFYKTLPFIPYKNGRKLRFLKSEVVASLKAQPQNADFQANVDDYILNN